MEEEVRRRLSEAKRGVTEGFEVVWTWERMSRQRLTKCTTMEGNTSPKCGQLSSPLGVTATYVGHKEGFPQLEGWGLRWR